MPSTKFLDKCYKLYFDCMESREFVIDPNIWSIDKKKYNKIANNYFNIVNNMDNENERFILLNSCRSVYYSFMLKHLID